MARRVFALWVAVPAAMLAGCASDGYSGGSSASVGVSYYHGQSWYDDPYYWYGPPGYVVVPPDNVDRPDRPVKPTQPIAPEPGTPGARPQPRPAAKPAPSVRTSRMPSAQPRVSSASHRASIPRAPRGRR